jgi:uncharacterized protein YukE
LPDWDGKLRGTIMDGFDVTPEDLRAAATTIAGIADEAHRNVAELSGVQNAMSDQATGFEVIRAAAEVEASWQHAVQVQAAKLALDGDVLELNADTYVETDLRAGKIVGER